MVGLTLEAGAHGQAVGALILFLTNVGAILLSGLIVMTLYRVFEVAATDEPQVNRRLAAVVVGLFVLILTVPLALSSVRITSDTLNRERVAPVAEKWANASGWKILEITSSEAGVDVQASGGFPEPNPQLLKQALDAAGLRKVRVVLELVPSQRIPLPGG